MAKAQRRYFVCEGEEAERLAAEIWAERERFAAATSALQERYQASAVFVRNQATVTGIGFSDATKRPGFKIDDFETDGHHMARPDRRTKEGREIVTALKEASAKEHPSETIVRHYGASAWVPQSDPMSRTGMSMAIAVGHPLPDRKRLTLSVPVSEKEPFSPPAGVREIKKSEYIALTEES